MPILDKAQPATKLYKDPKVKALLVGPSKSGKTTSAVTIMEVLPKDQHALLVDVDLRASSVYGTPNLDILQVLEPDPRVATAWRDLGMLRTELWTKVRANKFPYGAIIVDGLTKLNTFSMNYVLTLRRTDGTTVATGLGGAPAQPHYTPQMQELARFVNSILPLPCHVIFTGHLDLYKDEHLGTLQYFPRVYGKTRTEIGSWFDETYLCHRHPVGKNDVIYEWITTGTDRTDFLGSSINKRGKLWTSPIKLDLDQSPAGFAKLLELSKGGAADAQTVTPVRTSTQALVPPITKTS